MFTSVSSRSANAYKAVGIETSVTGASAHHLVSLLFDALQEALMSAKQGILVGDIPAKSRAIGHAVRILEEGLKAGLDLKKGGVLAANLSSLYDYCIFTTIEANLHNDSAKVDEVVQLIQRVSDGWSQIKNQVNPHPFHA